MLLNELSFQEEPKNIQRKNNLVMAQKNLSTKEVLTFKFPHIPSF